MKQRISEAWLRTLQPSSVLGEGQERIVLWDARQKGLGLVVHQSGTLSWIVRYSLYGKPGKKALGKWPDVSYEVALKRAQSTRGKVAGGEDPQRKRGNTTVAKLALRFEKEHCPKLAPSTVRTYKMLLTNHILPKLGKLTLEEVKLGDVGKFHTGLRAHPRTANQALAVISKMLSLAETWGLRDPNTNPCGAIERYAENKRERYLTSEEMAELGKRLVSIEKGMNPYVVAALRVGMLTGMRKGEITKLRWDQIESEGLVFKEHKTAKQAGRKVIPITEPVRAILSDLDKVLGSPLVFPGEKGGACTQALRTLWEGIRKGTTFEDVRFHDLRHTFASIGVMEGLTLEQIGGLLGHKAAATTKRYAHLMQEAAQQAAAKAAQAVAGRLG